jgi:hypothetical protein
MAGFAYRKNLDGSSQSPTLLHKIGKSSVTFSVGDLVRVDASGFVDVVDADENSIAGVCQMVVDSDGKAIDTDSGTNDTWTMESDNETVDQYKVAFIPALPNYIFYNDADDSLTRTMEFQYFDTNNEYQVDVASATDSATAMVKLIERDPDHDGDASKGLFQIVESQFATDAVDTAAHD